MHARDRAPNDYGDLMIEAIPVAPTADGALVAFQLWDMEDFDVEATAVFRVSSFDRAERVATLDGLAEGLVVAGDEALVLTRRVLRRFDASTLAPGEVSTLPFTAKALGAFGGRIWAVGSGAGHLQGADWSSIEGLAPAPELLAVDHAGDRVVAAGKDGLLVQLAPTLGALVGPTTATVCGLAVEGDGRVALATREGAWLGTPNGYHRLTLPEGVRELEDVCVFQGRRVWCGLAGVFVEADGALVRSLEEACFHLTATAQHLFAAGEREVHRFDGTRWQTLRLLWDPTSSQWALRTEAEIAVMPVPEPVGVFGSFQHPKGAVGRELTRWFDQRVDLAPWAWKRPAWAPAFERGASASEVSFAVLGERCTFTLPCRRGDLEPLAAFLASKGVKDLELRPSVEADLAENRSREVAAAAVASRKPPKVVATHAGQPLASGPWAVTVIHPYEPYEPGVHPPHDLIAVGAELIGLGNHKRGPQLNRISGFTTRTIANLIHPAVLDGVSRGPDGALRAGGGSAGTIYVSHDAGQRWALDETSGAPLGEAIRSTCWHQGALWVAGRGRIARQDPAGWTDVPTGLAPPDPWAGLRLVSVGSALFALGRGVERWDGRAFVPELAWDSAVSCVAASAQGALFATGLGLWRRPPGGAWEQVFGDALGIDPAKPAEREGFQALIPLGDALVLVGNHDEPRQQKHVFRISEDGGSTFRPVTVPGGHRIVTSAAIADPDGGVLCAGFGGLLVRLNGPR